MARSSAKNTDIYIDTHAVEGYANSFNIGVDVNLPEVTTFGDAGATFVEGKANPTFDMNAFFSPTDNESDEIINDALTGTSEIFYTPSGMTIGNIGYHFQTNLTSRTIDNPVDGATALNVSKLVSFVTTATDSTHVSLANGTITGQIKKIVHKTRSNSVDLVITPANFHAGAILTSNLGGRGVELIWDGTNWQVIAGEITGTAEMVIGS